MLNRKEFLQRLIGIAGLGFLSIEEAKATQKVYLLQSFVAGFRFHKGMELLPYMKEQDLVELKREPDNEHDSFAVAVYWQQEMIGYLPAASNEIIARLMDAGALALIGTITHLQHDAKPWENVAVAVCFVQPEKKNLPEYLTILLNPVYTSVKKKEKKSNENLPDVFDYYERVIELDEIPDEAAKAYFTKYYSKHSMQINGKIFVKVPDDGIYTYMYNVHAAEWIMNEKGEKFLEFIFLPET